MLPGLPQKELMGITGTTCPSCNRALEEVHGAPYLNAKATPGNSKVFKITTAISLPLFGGIERGLQRCV